MKKIEQFLADLHKLKVQLWNDGEGLRYQAPNGVMTAETLAELSARKAEIVHFLQAANGPAQQVLPAIIPVLQPNQLSQQKQHPLSFAQQRLWFLDQLEEGGATYYNMPGALRMKGTLDIDALQSTLSEIIHRHEVIRTTFVMVEDEVVQIVNEAVPIQLEIVDIQSYSPAEQASKTQQRIATEAQRPFDLARELLLRATLLKLGPEEHVLIAVIHHIVSDGWSMGVFVQELSMLYEAFALGLPSPLDELPIQYSDFTHWQRQHLNPTQLAPQLDYWRDQLAAMPPVLDLPTDRPRPQVQRFRGCTAHMKIDGTLVHAIRALAHQHGATLFMTLLTAFVTLLARLSHQEDIAVGSPIANRGQKELESLIGFFVNTLVLRADITGNPTFEELLDRVRRTALGAYAHQDIPFEHLVEALQPERNLSHSPLFQVMFALQNVPEHDLILPGLMLEQIDVDVITSRFDLTLALTETSDGLSGIWDYDGELFDLATIERFSTYFTSILQEAARSPATRVWELPLLNEAEQGEIVTAWRGKTRDLSDQCIHELFQVQASHFPSESALVYQGEHLSYAALDARSNQLASYLQSLGVGPEMAVGICMDRSPEMAVGILAVLKAGGAYVPLDPTYPHERLAYMLADANISILLTQSHLSEKVPASGIEIVCLDRLVLTEPSTRCQSSVVLDNLAYIIYTSGSTGEPKGVQVTHRSLHNVITEQIQRYELQANCHLLKFLSLTFDAANSHFFMALCSGATLHLVEPDDILESEMLCQRLKEHGITHAPLPSAILARLPDVALPALKVIITGGEACSTMVVERWASRVHFSNEYGPTEATICSTIAKCLPDGQRPPIGQPIANTAAYILDASGQPVPMGLFGELYIAGAGLARGYHGHKDRTAERFLPDPFTTEAGARMYRTGDLARYRADGQLEFLGRADHQIKIRGHRIELGEIETVLNRYPSVDNAIVMAQPYPTGEPQLVAYVVPTRPTNSPDGQSMEKGAVESDGTEQYELVAALRTYLKSLLPDYMCPAAFLLLPALPLTPNGKVDRKALPIPDSHEAHIDQTPPRTPTEEIIASIWHDVLGRKAGIHADFFELGGHSLLATQVVSRLREAFSCSLLLRTLFEAPTIAGLGDIIDSRSKTEGQIAMMPIGTISREEPLPLSFAQQRLWFLEQLEGATPLYNIPMMLHIHGPLRQDVLQRCLDEIVQRHESLRTIFQDDVAQQGMAYQVVMPDAGLPLHRIDLRSVTADAQAQAIQDYAQQEAQHIFHLSTGPLIRATLLCLSQDEHIFLLTMHHIVSDGWSIGVVIHELTELYQAFWADKPSPLPPLPIQYGDFAYWQRQWLAGPVLEQQLGYWHQQLADAPPLLELPTDRPRPSVQTFRGAVEPFMLDADILVGLKELSQRSGATLFMTLLAAFTALLARYSSQDDIVVGTPIANRTRREIEPLIGFFLNTLVLRLQLEDDPPFHELIKRARQVALDGYAHQDVPFEQLVEMLQPQRNLSHSPLCQVMLILQNAPLGSLTLPDLTITQIEVAADTAKHDLTLTLEESDSGLSGAWEYNCDLFDKATIQRMMTHFHTLLTAIITDSEQRVSELAILTADERHQILVEWNATTAHYPNDAFVHTLFAEQVARTPNAIAFRSGDELLTYRELDTQSNRLAHYLLDQGVSVGSRIGICLPRDFDLTIAFIAVFKVGGVYLPLDPGYPRERLQYMATDAELAVILTYETLADVFRSTNVQIVTLDTERAAIARFSNQRPPMPRLEPTSLAYIIYTSGSTGQPKGVAIPHRQIINRLFWMWKEYPFVGDEVGCLRTALNFVDSIWELLGALLQGIPTVLIPDEVVRDPEIFIDLLAHYGVTRLWVVPSLLRMMLDAYPDLQQRLPKLAFWSTGGEAIAKTLFERFLAQMPNSILYNVYGTSEVWDVTCYVPDSQLEKLTRVPIGRPISNMQTYVLDTHLQPVPIGVPGILYVGGDGLAVGYLNRPALTNEKFISNPFTEKGDNFLYNTGDLVRYLPPGADGLADIEYIGRCDNQVKIRGFRIELGEVEAALLQHTAVHMAMVILREDTLNSPRLVGYIVPRQDGLASEELRVFLRHALPDYMVPAVFVFLDQLPLTPSGKVNRFALPVPEKETDRELVLPRTPTEETLVTIWSELLEVNVGIHDNFFDLGGHSLLATQAMSRLHQRLGSKLPLRALFQAPTIAELSVLLEDARNGSPLSIEAAAIKPMPRPERVPLSFAQQRLWFLDQLGSGSAYNMPATFRLTGEVNVDVLKQSLNEIVARHETLRTAYRHRNGLPYQSILSPQPIPFNTVDLREMASEAQTIKLIQLAEEEAVHLFDLTQDLPIRVTLIHLAEEAYALFITMHHIASDGWSIGIFVHELVELYTIFLKGEPSSLPELPIQYADFALWQREWLQGDILAELLDYWRGELSGELPVLDLPLDHPRPAEPSHRGNTISITFPQTLVAELERLNRQEGVTMFMTLLAAFKCLLFRYTGQTDILVGTPIANRNRAELEGLIGFLANTLVLRTKWSGDPNFRALLHQVRESTLNGYAHQDLPFEKLVEVLQPDRNLSHNPLFQVVFALQNVPAPRLEFPGITLAPLTESESQSVRFDLEIHVRAEENGLNCYFVYCTDLFEAETIVQFANHYQIILQGIVENPNERLHDLPLLIQDQSQETLHIRDDTDITTSSSDIEQILTQIDTLSDEKVTSLLEEMMHKRRLES